MSKLHLIDVMGQVVTKEVPQTHLEYDDSIWKEMKTYLGEDFMEHVSVWFNGAPSHMFVDENGLAKGLFMNPKATRIYWNNTFRKERDPKLQYDDLTKTPEVVPTAVIQRYRLEHYVICGKAALWEGKME